MNVINMNHDEYLKNMTNENFCETQMKRFSSWLLDYSDAGEMAFYNFGLMSDGNLKMIMGGCHDPVDNQYGIITYAPTKLANKPWLPTTCWWKLMPNGRLLDLCVDIPEGSKEWQELGVNDMSDLPLTVKREMGWFSKSVMCLFARIQTDALKCKKKIIRMQKQAESHEPRNKKTSDKEPKNKTIVLSPTITYSFQNESKEAREFTRHCEAWSVRGHYRHYKNGNTIYIKPYQKGTGRLKDTTYKIKEEH